MGSNAPGPRRPLSDAVRSLMEGYVRGAELSNMMGRQNANATAQRTSDGLGIQNIRRGVARASLDGAGSNLTIATGGAYAAVGLEFDMVLSGRPLRITLTGTSKAGVGGLVSLDVTLRGSRIGSVLNGLAYTQSQTPQGFCGVETVMAPAGGTATLAVVARAVTATGTVYVDTDNRLVLMAEEL